MTEGRQDLAAVIAKLERWLGDNSHEDIQRHARRVSGRCEYCGYERHHSTTGACDFTFRAAVGMQPQLVRDALALLLAEAPHDQEKKEDTATRVDDTQYDPPSAGPLATASDNELGPAVPSCRCPAAKGEDCPLTQDECDARTVDHIGHPWFGARLRRVYDGFVRESMNGVVCSIPDTGLNTPPNRTWCVNCQGRYMELKAIVEMLEPSPPPASRTAAPDVAEGERPITPNQKRNEVIR